MLNLARTHDYQVQLSPSEAYPAAVNPPSFNWPENIESQKYTLELKNLSTNEVLSWEQVNSPMQLSSELSHGKYQWRLKSYLEANSEQVSKWIDFEIKDDQPNYIAPTAKQLFEQCDAHEQWLMYFDKDIESIKQKSPEHYSTLKQTAKLSVPQDEISYPRHYQRGQEEGKREAIANVRKWIDRDLMTHTLLYKIWGEEEHGGEAVERLLQLAEWSPEGPASLLRPCTWGDEVGCSLARNLFLAYHWLSPLLKESEKAFVRPMLIRIARQITGRLAQDNFKQFPGHSHTSRLPSYLGLAALALYREHDREECEEWLTEALMIYRGILPFYGGIDGSWVEGSFYASTYSKWFHPFFLSVERISSFSFYQHPFYQNFHNFARDFITPKQDIHPFGDGFWCKRDGKEWPGFFSQNPMRIYAARFGNQADYQQSLALDKEIKDLRLHLLDFVPTIKQIEFIESVTERNQGEDNLSESNSINHFYAHAGFGKLTQQQMSTYYRSSAFGNSSHRHGDQGNVALFDNGVGVLIPTGSYGYRFGSKHHKDWTRKTIAHNLPLIGDVKVSEAGQKLDDVNGIGKLIKSTSESNYHIVVLDLSEAYGKPLDSFMRTIVLIKDYGLLIVDSITLNEEKTLNWRLHSPLNAELRNNDTEVLLASLDTNVDNYKCNLISHSDIKSTLLHGYLDELNIPERSVESDASKDVFHLDWQLPKSTEHTVVASCIKEDKALPVLRNLSGDSEAKVEIEMTSEQGSISIPIS